MLSYTIRRLSQPKARGFLYRNSSFGIKRYSKEQEETKTPFNDITREEEARFLDLRPKNPFLKNPKKVSITGKEIENSILYNSFIDSFVDKAPFMKRVVKWRELELKNKIRNKKELLTKHVDSLVISKLSSPSIETSNTLESEECSQENADLVNRFPFDSFTPINQKYSRFQKRQLEKQTILDDDFDYGTSNPDIPISKIPCGGCGALLHCQNTSVPGYLPSEIFSGKTKHELRGKICQRCRFLREHNVALNVQIKPEDYPKVLSVIQDKIAIVILVVDLLDFPCSIWPGLLDIIGLKRPVLVVGNKVDLLPKDSPGYLDGIKKSLMQSLEQSDLKRANVKDVCLVSATTGYGVEQLITKIQSTWGFRGDAYLMGCTNVGKSSLFNALIQSDLCKTQAVDLLERATVSPWPGTTLNLLKFPLLRPTGTRLTDRIQRLMAESQVRAAEQEERRMQLKKSRRPEHATLIGNSLSLSLSCKTCLKNVKIMFSFDLIATRCNISLEGPCSKNCRQNEYNRGDILVYQVISVKRLESIKMAWRRPIRSLFERIKSPLTTTPSIRTISNSKTANGVSTLLEQSIMIRSLFSSILHKIH